jgi:hypothetical protein
MSEEERKLAQKCVQLRFSSTTAAALLSSWDDKIDKKYKKSQIDYLKKKQLEELFASAELDGDATAATRLKASMNNR